MTPKEKAKELIDKYQFVYIQNYTSMFEVKQCALIAVDEMIDIRNGLYINEGSIAHQWLLDVKQEIEKL